MTPIQIIQEILNLLPGGIQLTESILALIQAISAAFGNSTPAQQKAVVAALSKAMILTESHNEEAETCKA